MELIKNNLVSIVLFLLTVLGGFTWSLIQKGGEAEFKERVEAIIKEKMDDAHIIQTLLESKQVQEFTDDAGQEIRNAIIEDVTRQDSNKINQNAFLGKELGIRDEAVTPLLRDLLRDYKEGKLATKEDVRPRRNPTTWVDPMNVNGN